MVRRNQTGQKCNLQPITIHRTTRVTPAAGADQQDMVVYGVIEVWSFTSPADQLDIGIVRGTAFVTWSLVQAWTTP